MEWKFQGKSPCRFAPCSVLFAIAVCLGCSDGGEELRESPAVPPAEAPDPTIEARSSSGSMLAEKVKFKTAGGETAWSIKRKDDGAKLVDFAEQEIARFTVDGSELKIKDPQDAVLGWIRKTDTKYRIVDRDGQTVLFSLQSQDDGDWKLEDPKGDLLCRFKMRAYGYEVESPAEESLFKAKLDGDKRSLRGSQEETVLYTDDSVSMLGVAFLGPEFVQSLPLRAAMATYLTLSGD